MIAELRAKSQVTIPKELVDKLGLAEGDKFEVFDKDGMIYLMPVVVVPKLYFNELTRGKLQPLKSGDASGESENKDKLFKQALELAARNGEISTSMLQRMLGMGYGRAARAIDQMERLGYVSPSEGPNKPRKVLISTEDYEKLAASGEI